MKATDLSPLAEDYRRVEKAIRYLEENFRSQPTLEQIAMKVHLSKYHFNRLFKRWAGISPMRFLQFLTLEYTRPKLSRAHNILDTAFDSGLSGPGRLHDLYVTFEAMTPGEFKQKGAGVEIRYGFHPTPFGESLLAKTDRGICHLGFIDGENRLEALQKLEKAWPAARLRESGTETGPIVASIFRQHPSQLADRPFHLLLKGTNFQVNVWRALLTIPAGAVVSYRHIAALMGRPKAVRAAANAIAVNPVGYLIPCHRVIASSGHIHRYQWGTARKMAMHGWEAAVAAH